eukprot:2462996-Rhodomonas_salina.2
MSCVIARCAQLAFPQKDDETKELGEEQEQARERERKEAETEKRMGMQTDSKKREEGATVAAIRYSKDRGFGAAGVKDADANHPRARVDVERVDLLHFRRRFEALRDCFCCLAERLVLAQLVQISQPRHPEH